MSDNNIQKFFSQGKKIPKDVKRHCGMCKQHGIYVETRGHNCEYKSCRCDQCQLVRKRREIMSTQIRLRREQDKKFRRTTNANEADVLPWEHEDEPTPDTSTMCYFCQKCKNHGVLMWKKDHKKNCQYIDCRCDQCDLIDSRRALDRHIKKKKTKEDSSKKIPAATPDAASTASSSIASSSSCSPISKSTSPMINIASYPFPSFIPIENYPFLMVPNSFIDFQQLLNQFYAAYLKPNPFSLS